MRKLLTKGNKTKKDQRNSLIVGIVLIILMVGSSIGYAFFSSTQDTELETVVYNNREFIQTSYNTWQFIYANNKYETQYNPEQTQNISVKTTKVLGSYSNKALYFGVEDINDVSQIGMNEVLVNIGDKISRQNMACLNENCTEDYPIKNCSIDNIIIFKISNETMVIEEEKCIYIHASRENSVKAVDAFLFKIMGI